MPARSQQQMKYIYAMRGKYGSKKKAPKDMKWVFDEEWTSGVKMKKLPKTVADKKKKDKKKNESHIMNFKSFVNEAYGHDRPYSFEDFTTSDMEFIKELYNDGLTDAKQLSIESDLSEETVVQILDTLKKRGDINESESFDEHEDNSGCGCDICNCVGNCECECCCVESVSACGCEDCHCDDCRGRGCECGCCCQTMDGEDICPSCQVNYIDGLKGLCKECEKNW